MNKVVKRVIVLALALSVAMFSMAWAETGGKIIAPMPAGVDVNALQDGIYPVAFEPGDVTVDDDGIVINAVRVYAQDWYDLVDVNTLEVGDTIIVEGEEVPVMTIGRADFIEINEGAEGVEAFCLGTEEDTNGFTVRGLDDMHTYTEQGETALRIDSSATFTDAWDIESEPVTVDYDGIVEAIQTSRNDSFVPYNTTVRVEAGAIVEINRIYTP